MKRAMNGFLVLLVFACAGFADAQATLKDKDLPNFAPVEANFYRGGQPTEAGVKKLAAMGVKTIIDLRGEDETAKKEKIWAENAGIKFVGVSLNNWLKPKTEDIENIMGQIDAAHDAPVFVHCQRGADRTGTVVAVYRMTHDDYTAKQAIDEAKKFKFGWWQFWMKDYINDYYRENIERKKRKMDDKKQMHESILQTVLDEADAAFRNYKKLAEKVLAQISDDEFFEKIDAESNSAAEICKHIGGNLRSRWADFLMTDGEKADRNRDAEFVAANDTRQVIEEVWNAGWQTLSATLQTLTAEDLAKTVTIRGEKFTVVKAINRSLTHTAYHVGQIAFLAKHLRGAAWKTLSVPKNQSAEFAAWLKSKEDKDNYLEAAQNFAGETLK